MGRSVVNMKRISRYLYIPALLPISLALALGILNLNKRTRIQFLVWTSPNVSVGSLILLATSSSFAIGAIPYFIFTNSTIQKSRKVKVDDFDQTTIKSNQNVEESKTDNYLSTDNYLERDIRDPSPTIQVPFRVISNPQNQVSKSDMQDFYSPSQDENIKQASSNRPVSQFPTDSDNSDWMDTLDDHW